MNVEVKLDPHVLMNAAVQMPLLNMNHVFRYDYLREWFGSELEEVATKDIRKDKSKSKTGWVDIKNQKVGGYYSDMEIPIWIGFDGIVKIKSGWNETAEEITAVILHEVGHAFSFFIAMHYLIRSNSALQSTHRELMECSTQSSRVKLLTTVSSDLDVTIDDIDGLAVNNDKDMISTVLLSGMMKNIRNELGGDIYDMRDCEAMADNFAAKNGFGLELVTGLDKFPAYNADKYGRSRNMLMLLLQIVLNVGLTAMSAGLWLFVVFNINNTKKIYDDPVERYTRIRQDIIGNLKSQNVPAKVRDKALDDIEVIDKIISKYNNKPELFVAMSEFFLKEGRRNKSVRKLNQLFEKMANNDLYVAAAKFERLA